MRIRWIPRDPNEFYGLWDPLGCTTLPRLRCVMISLVFQILTNNGGTLGPSLCISYFEGVCVEQLPSSLPMGARNGGPKRLPAGEGGGSQLSDRSNASLADILCTPPVAARVWFVFFEKALPFRVLCTFFLFATPLG